MSRRPRRVAILGHIGRRPVQQAARRLLALLARRGVEARIERALAAELGREGAPLADLARWCEILVALGGDGTMLTGARALAGCRGALLPINLGGLGFLTVAEAPELSAAMRAALDGAWPVTRLRPVSAAVRRRGRVIRRQLAMNDAVVKAATGQFAVHLRLSTLGRDLGHLVADGVIVASPSGSTAYSLSAGGPVVAPDVEAVIVTPVCPHTIGSRPLVLPPEAGLRVRVMGSADGAVLALDGHEVLALEPGDEVEARLARVAVRLFQNPARPFSRSLQAKLGWQGSARRSL